MITYYCYTLYAIICGGRTVCYHHVILIFFSFHVINCVFVFGYHLMLLFVLSFILCYYLMLPFFVITFCYHFFLFYYSWKHDTLIANQWTESYTSHRSLVTTLDLIFILIKGSWHPILQFIQVGGNVNDGMRDEEMKILRWFDRINSHLKQRWPGLICWIINLKV